jgi:NCAIR mutase (PurE)-related protein
VMSVLEERLRALLEGVRRGHVGLDEALRELRDLPFADLGFARLDHHRSLRQGIPEVVFGQGKTPEQVAELVTRLVRREGRALATRVDVEAYHAVQARLPHARYDPEARLLTVQEAPLTPPERAPYAVVASGGTADIPVAQEAALTLEFLGDRVERLYDVGVAGLHRLLASYEALMGAAVVVAVAGMEGALPSVIKGMVPCPVIAVPTSVGYGAGFHGLAPLLAMLNSCAPGVAVVNIDNGFGAGVFAHLILTSKSPPQEQRCASPTSIASPASAAT